MKFVQYLAAAVLFLSVVPVHAQASLFDTAVNYGAGDGPVSVFSADLDGDNDSDLAVANVNSDNVSILLNNSDYAGGVLPFALVDGVRFSNPGHGGGNDVEN